MRRHPPGHGSHTTKGCYRGLWRLFDPTRRTRWDQRMSTRTDQIMYVHSPEFAQHTERIAEVTDATSRLNTVPFSDVHARAELLSVVFGGAASGVGDHLSTVLHRARAEHDVRGERLRQPGLHLHGQGRDPHRQRCHDRPEGQPHHRRPPAAARRTSRVPLLRPDRHRGRRVDRRRSRHHAGRDTRRRFRRRRRLRRHPRRSPPAPSSPAYPPRSSR